jgi:hypothetical protein
MGLPARSLPARVALAAPNPEAAERLRAAWADVLDYLRGTRPGDGTGEEREAIRRFIRCAVMTLTVVEGSVSELLRHNIDDALLELVRQELETSVIERKFALRQIEVAAQVAGVIFEQLGSLLNAMPDEGDVARQVLEHAEHMDPLSEADLTFVRFQLDLLVALESFAAPVDELTYWAKRAVTGARRVQALHSPVSPAGLRGELARLRSRNAWRSWDAEEIEREFAPWPKPNATRSS